MERHSEIEKKARWLCIPKGADVCSRLFKLQLVFSHLVFWFIGGDTTEAKKCFFCGFSCPFAPRIEAIGTPITCTLVTAIEFSILTGSLACLEYFSGACDKTARGTPCKLAHKVHTPPPLPFPPTPTVTATLHSPSQKHPCTIRSNG